MPITPYFELAQTCDTLILDIDVPHIRVRPSDFEIVVEDSSIVHFAVPPYLLLLDFSPNKLQDSDDDDDELHVSQQQQQPPEQPSRKAVFEPNIRNGRIRVRLRKQTLGWWDNLEWIGRLQLRSKKVGSSSTPRWLQAVVQVENGNHQEESGEANDYCSRYMEDDENNNQKKEFQGDGAYGFNRMFYGIFKDLIREGMANEMVEDPWPEEELLSQQQHYVDSFKMIRCQRRVNRRKLEDEKFSKERYMGDLDIQDDYIYQVAMMARNNLHWIVEHETSPEDEKCYFTKQEQNLLLQIPYPLLPESVLMLQRSNHRNVTKTFGLAAGLLDLLFAYVYDHWITEGEPTVESAWTISMLSASLSWLEDWLLDKEEEVEAENKQEYFRETVKSVMVSSMRRSLIYPYLRNFDLGLFIWSNVTMILRDVRMILRSLLQVHQILDHSENFYLGNKLYVNGYIAWLQMQNDSKIFQTDILNPMIDEIQKVLDSEDFIDCLSLNLTSVAESDESGSDSCTSEEDESNVVDDNSSVQSRTIHDSAETTNSHAQESRELLELTQHLSGLQIVENLNHSTKTECPQKEFAPLIQEVVPADS